MLIGGKRLAFIWVDFWCESGKHIYAPKGRFQNNHQVSRNVKLFLGYWKKMERFTILGAVKSTWDFKVRSTVHVICGVATGESLKMSIDSLILKLVMERINKGWFLSIWELILLKKVGIIGWHKLKLGQWYLKPLI